MPTSRRSFCGAIPITSATINRPMTGSRAIPPMSERKWRVWPDAGACAFPCAPEDDPRDVPALWAPSLAAMIVIIDVASLASDDPPSLDIEGIGDVIADHIADDGRHIVIADRRDRHRIWMRGTTLSDPTAFVLPACAGFATRLAATARLERRLRRLPRDTGDNAAQPTPFQRQRLVLLLRLIDAASAKATRREMAFTLIYPRPTSLTGAAWKGSNERRRTLRLLAEATRMMRGGYRALLQNWSDDPAPRSEGVT